MQNKGKYTPKISVIIPTYNYGKYIEECIKSVLRQTWENIEIIVVDDGSTDETFEIIKNINLNSLEPFGNYRNFIYIYQENKGFPSAHNVGLQRSTGDYVLILDADDFFWVDDAIEQLFWAISQYDGVMAFGRYVKVWSNGKIEFSNYYNSKKVLSSKEIVRNLLLRDFIPIGGALINGDVAREIGFDERIPFLQDYPFKIKVASRGKVIFVDAIILGYRQHDFSYSRNQLRMYQDTLKAIEIIKKESQIHIPNRIYLKSLSRLYYKVGQEYELKGLLREAFSKYLHSVIYCPFNYKAWILLLGLLFGGVLVRLRRYKEVLRNVP